MTPSSRTRNGNGDGIVVYHNPACGNSRGVLELLRERGIEPRVVEYLRDPPDRATLAALAEASGLGMRGLARSKEPLYEDLGLGAADVDDDALLDAMLAHPVLINRPIVATPLGVRLCRPPETVLEILPAA